jgi:hypothetical protein
VEIKGKGKQMGKKKKAAFQFHVPKFRKNPLRLEFEAVM